jgi:CheY-like chemotaxis protein
MASDAVTVLVADDNAEIRLLVRLALARRGYKVVEAETGEDALVLVRLLRPNVAILDNEMPGLKGLEVAEALADDRSASGTRVLMVSGSIRPDDAGAQGRRGVHAYLPKPFSVAALQALVASLVGERDDISRSA